VTLTTPSGPGRVGPGISVSVVNSLVGPIPNDDIVVVFLANASGAPSYITGSRFARGAHTVAVTLGKLESPFFGSSAIFTGIVDNAAMWLTAAWADSSGSIYDSVGPSSGWLWDATSGLWKLVTDAPTSGVLFDILNAVSVVKTTPGQV